VINNIFKFLFAIMLVTSTMPAVVYIYELDTEFSGGTDPVGPSPWAFASFQQVDPNTVQLELSNFNLTGSEFVGAWYLNFNDSLNVNNLNFNRVGGTAVADASISTGINAFKADGDGFFDILLDFPQKKADRFGAGDNIIYEITGVNLINPEMFNFGSAPGGGNGTWYSAAHVQGIGPDAEASGWIGSGPGVPVPEPTTYLMLAAMLGIGFLLTRKSRKLVEKK